MQDIYDILKINAETLRDFHLHANRIDDYQTSKIINQNLRKLKEIEGRVYADGNLSVSRQSIDEVLYKVVEASKTNDFNLDNWTARELRIVSYYLMKLQNEESVYNFALKLLERKWRNLYFNGLIFFMMNSWNMIKPQLRRNTCDLITEKLLEYEDSNRKYLLYKDNIDFFEDAGPARMAAVLVNRKEDVLEAPLFIGNKQSSISQSYYSEVIIKYCEKINVGVNGLERIFEKHQDTRTKKLVLADMVIKAESSGDTFNQTQLSKFINRILGDVTLTATWAPFPGATSEEAAKLKKAMQLANLWFARRIIETFFEVCVQDRDRKTFWLQYVQYVSGFKIVGSTLTRHVLQNDPRTSGMFLPHFILTNSTSSQTSALVLCIKNKVMVEFSDTGALYVYNQYHPQVKFLRTVTKSMSSTADLKIPSMGKLVDTNYWGEYNVYNEEGRMMHIGHWRTRLTNWIRTKLLTASNTEVSFFDTRYDSTFVAKELPKEEAIRKPQVEIVRKPLVKETPTFTSPAPTRERTIFDDGSSKENRIEVQRPKLHNVVQYEKNIRCTIVGKWLFNNACRVVCNQKGYYLQVGRTLRFAFLRDLLENLRPAGNIWIKSALKYEWHPVVHSYIGKEHTIGFIRKGGSGTIMFKQEYNQPDYLTILPS